MLTQEQLAALPETDKERYTALERLFVEPGWKVLAEWAAANATTFRDRTFYSANWEQHIANRVSAEIYTLLANLTDSVTKEYEAIAAAATEAKPGAADDEFEIEFEHS